MTSRPLLILVCGCAFAGPVAAGNLDAPAAPTTPGGGAMYTLDDLYNRLNDGTAGAPRSTVFVEPGSEPGGTMHTLTDIMGKMPVVDNTNGATAANVPSGKTFWGLTSGAWGLQTGAMATGTVTNATTSQSAGYYTAFDLATVDTDLAATNIKSGVSIFGVAGTYTGSSSGGTISAPYPVAKTGAGIIANYTLDSSEDGALQKGVAWPDPRFTDNNNGTVTDNLTGLVWLKDANCANKSWSTALTWVATLKGDNTMCTNTKLNDGSVAGQWRLPTIKELSSLVNAGTSKPALPVGHPFTGVPTATVYNYWSSMTGMNSGVAWGLALQDGTVSNTLDKNLTYYVWPVRGGQ